MKASVLNLVFPLDAVPPPYLWRVTLRFSDPESQIVVVVRPRAKSEVVQYALAGMSDEEFSQLILQTLAEDSNAKAEEIAAKVKVSVDRTSIDSEMLSRALGKLSGVRISPQPDGVCLGRCSRFEYWYDAGLQSVHYVIVGADIKGDPQYQLVQWMIGFRKDLPRLEKLNVVPKKSRQP